MENYTLLTNKLFYNKEELNLFNECKDYKLLPVMDYLYINTNRKGITIFTLENMIIKSGFKVDTHKGKSLDQFKNILKFLQFKKIIDLDLSIDDLKKNDFVECIFNGLDKDDKGHNIKFVALEDKDKDKILSYSEQKIDNLKLLYYFCYLRSRMYKRTSDEHLIGGNAEVCYPSYKTIQDDIGLTDNTVKQYNDILVNLGLIKIGNLGLYYLLDDKNKLTRESNNIYAYVNGNEDREIKQFMEFYENKHTDRQYLGTREYKNNNRQVNGYIARVNQLEKEGKATEQQIEKKNSLIESKNIKEDTIKDLKEELSNVTEIEFGDIEEYILQKLDEYGEENYYTDWDGIYTIEDLKRMIEDAKEELNQEKQIGFKGNGIEVVRSVNKAQQKETHNVWGESNPFYNPNFKPYSDGLQNRLNMYKDDTDD